MTTRRDERGAVTAETAVALPVLVVLALALAWMVSLGMTQVRVHDAAREVVRAAARGEAPARAVALGRQVAPPGARITLGGDGDTVVATVTSRTRAPGGLLGRWAAVPVTARAVAGAEPTAGPEPGGAPR